MIHQALVGRPSDRDPEEIVRFANTMVAEYGSEIRFYSAFDEETGNEAILCSALPMDDPDSELWRLLHDDSGRVGHVPIGRCQKTGIELGL